MKQGSVLSLVVFGYYKEKKVAYHGTNHETAWSFHNLSFVLDWDVQHVDEETRGKKRDIPTINTRQMGQLLLPNLHARKYYLHLMIQEIDRWWYQNLTFMFGEVGAIIHIKEYNCYIVA